MRRRDLVMATLVGFILWLASWPYHIDYLTWVDSPIVWILSAALGLTALILTLAIYFRCQRAVMRGSAQDREDVGRR